MTPQPPGATAPTATNGVARLSIDDAARRLGISRPTVRRRLRSGVLKGTQVATPHGRKWLVEVPGTHESADGESVSPHGAAETGSKTPRPAAREVELLQAHVDDLRGQLEDRTREVRELHTLLAQAQARLLTDGQASPHGESPGSRPTPRTANGAAPGGSESRSRWWQRLRTRLLG
jgi:excisionase family DNA binding protein